MRTRVLRRRLRSDLNDSIVCNEDLRYKMLCYTLSVLLLPAVGRELMFIFLLFSNRGVLEQVIRLGRNVFSMSCVCCSRLNDMRAECPIETLTSCGWPFNRPGAASSCVVRCLQSDIDRDGYIPRAIGLRLLLSRCQLNEAPQRCCLEHLKGSGASSKHRGPGADRHAACQRKKK